MLQIWSCVVRWFMLAINKNECRKKYLINLFFWHMCGAFLWLLLHSSSIIQCFFIHLLVMYRVLFTFYIPQQNKKWWKKPIRLQLENSISLFSKIASTFLAHVSLHILLFTPTKRRRIFFFLPAEAQTAIHWNIRWTHYQLSYAASSLTKKSYRFWSLVFCQLVCLMLHQSRSGSSDGRADEQILRDPWFKPCLYQVKVWSQTIHHILSSLWC